MNIEFQYMYRDFGNFKNYGAVVFRNQSKLPVAAVNSQLIGALGQDRNFVAADLGVPGLFFKEFAHDPDLDWEMHEFCEVVQTDSPVSDANQRDIQDLLPKLRAPGAASDAN